MKIKNRLSVYFTGVSIVILLIVEVVLCLSFQNEVRSDFYDHLTDRARIAAQLYLEADEISPDSLTHVRERYLHVLPGEVIRLYNDNNAASFITDKNQYWPNSIIEQVRKHQILYFREGERQTAGIYYNDNQGNFVILVSAIDNSGNKRLHDLVRSMGILLLTVAVVLFLISRWFAQKMLQPIDEVVKQMQRVNVGNLSLRVDEGNGKDEISALAYNFNRLLAHLENAFEMQETFVINASHELRTPITSIIGEIEISLNKLRSTGEYEHVLKSVLTDASRLKETVTSLLEMAKVDMNYTQYSLAPVNIDELIWELNDYWTEKQGRGMFNLNVLQLPENPDKLLIPANKQLLTIAFNNIIGNAYKFSNYRPVTCDLFADGQQIKLTFIDQGVGIPQEEIEKVFESFYRGTNVKNYMGSGVGLYVTNKIVSLFNGKISIQPGTAEGTEITVTFAV